MLARGIRSVEWLHIRTCLPVKGAWFYDVAVVDVIIRCSVNRTKAQSAWGETDIRTHRKRGKEMRRERMEGNNRRD